MRGMARRCKALVPGGMLGALFYAVLFTVPVLAVEKGKAPVPAGTLALMEQRNMELSAPILIRSFKKESVLEVWKQTREGRFALLKSFPICRWSGQLGPKRR